MMRKATVEFMLHMAENTCSDREATIEALYHVTDNDKTAEQHLKALCYDLYLENRFDEALDKINETVTLFPQAILLVIIKV